MSKVVSNWTSKEQVKANVSTDSEQEQAQEQQPKDQGVSKTPPSTDPHHATNLGYTSATVVVSSFFRSNANDLLSTTTTQNQETTTTSSGFVNSLSESPQQQQQQRLETGQVSHTALMAALIHIMIGLGPFTSHLLPAQSAQVQREMLLASGVPVPSYSVSVAFLPLLGMLLIVLVYPNSFAIAAQRKHFFEQQARQALDSLIHSSHAESEDDDDDNNNGNNHILQFVSIGTGLDALQIRLSQEYPHVQFWEVDHPSTARVKGRGLYEMTKGRNVSSTSTESNIRQIPVNLGDQSLAQVLRSTPIYDSGHTFYMIEGVLCYLSQDQVQSLFQEIADIAPVGSIVAFDFLNWHTQWEAPQIGWMDWQNQFMLSRAAKRGEPFQWGLDPEKIQSFLGHEQWKGIQSKLSTHFPSKYMFAYLNWS